MNDKITWAFIPLVISVYFSNKNKISEIVTNDNIESNYNFINI